MHNVETLVWVILVLIGVTSSIVSSARKAVKAARVQAPVVRERVRAAQAARRADFFQQPVAPAIPSPPPVVITTAPAPRPAPPPRAAAPPPMPEHPVPAGTHGTPAFRGMFERKNLVRAIVAAEVLGPPKSLQEQSIWSPRHSEPSI